jgi:carboxymethylenebutenolidase
MMPNRRPTLRVAALCLLAGVALALCAPARADEDPLVMPEPVKFRSRDGRTELTGYVFKPLPAGRIKSVISLITPNEQAGKSEPGRFPGVVMLHGRGGPYSSAAKGRYDETTLSQRHLMWGRFWADRGYVAVLVDSFGPRGYPQGFPFNSYQDRPEEVSEQKVRPLDAYGALDYLRGRPDVIANRIAVQGWSNGGMTVLSALDLDRYADVASSQGGGFRAAIAMYPGCRAQVQTYYRPYAALLLLIAGADEEVSPAVCERLAAEVRDRTRYLTSVKYDGAVHAYDDPAPARQAVPANRTATEDSKKRAETFFKEWMSR